MSFKIITGNIFTSGSQTMVNTVNCAGVMGAGIALEYRLRYPVMYEKYQNLCDRKEIDIGKLWIYKSDDKWILNFPTKKHWKYPSKLEYLETGLQKFCETYKERGITSIAFPVLGGDKGGIDPHVSLNIMKSYLEPLSEIEIEIYLYDATALDDKFESFKESFSKSSLEQLSRDIGIGLSYIKKLNEALLNEDIKQLNQLGRVKGIGISTLEKVYKHLRSDREFEQKSLF